MIGWKITKIIEEDGGEVGVGMGKEEIEETNRSFALPWGRTVSVRAGIGEDVEDPVQFRIRDDDNVVYCEGVITKSLITECDDAYDIVRYAEAEFGAPWVDFKLTGNKWEVVYS